MSTAHIARHPSLRLEDAIGERRVVHHATTRKYFRLGLREAEFLASLDGSASLDELRQANCAGFDAAQVDTLLAWFGTNQLLLGSDAPPPPPKRLTQKLLDFATGPDKWRVHLVDPDAFLDRHRRAIDRLFSWPALACYLLVLLLPVAVPVSTADLLAVSMDHISAAQWFGIYAAMLLVIALHELAHAATCKHFGGRVNRIGVMLLYLQPIVYCDVSDSWRFRDTDKKIAVAVAGCFVQLLLSSLLLVLWRFVRIDAVLVFAMLNVVVALMNMLPFVKLDGYWIAVHLLDEPNLREKSFRALMNFASGRSGPGNSAQLLLFGAASALCTALFWSLGLLAIHRYVAKLSPMFASAAMGLLAAIALYRLARWLKTQLAQRRSDAAGLRNAP